MAQEHAEPKLHIDSDWKAQAQAEKERLSKTEQAQTQSSAGKSATGHELPEPDFRTLVGILAQQALMGLGTMGDPKTNRIIVDLTGARFSIDLLGLLEEKTKGNLSKEEADDLRQVLVELRSRFVQIADLVARSAKADPAAVAAAGARIAPAKP